MSLESLEERVAALEQKVAWLSRQILQERGPGRGDWRSTVGMFANDPIMKEIDEEARKIREEDRRQTRP
jgi:hypothetical protein